MKTLHKRLDPQKDEVLKVTETFGRFRAMRQFKVSSYDRFSLWLKEVTRDENFGLCPVINHNSDQTLGDQLVSAFLQKVAELETKNEDLRQRIEDLEWQLNHSGEKETQQALAILEACRA